MSLMWQGTQNVKKDIWGKKDTVFFLKYILNLRYDYMEFNNYLEGLDSLPGITVTNKEIIH